MTSQGHKPIRSKNQWLQSTKLLQISLLKKNVNSVVATPKQSPRCVSQLRAKAPENPSCLFHGGPRAHGGENSSCPGSALKPPLERN